MYTIPSSFTINPLPDPIACGFKYSLRSSNNLLNGESSGSVFSNSCTAIGSDITIIVTTDLIAFSYNSSNIAGCKNPFVFTGRDLGTLTVSGHSSL